MATKYLWRWYDVRVIRSSSKVIVEPSADGKNSMQWKIELLNLMEPEQSMSLARFVWSRLIYLTQRKQLAKRTLGRLHHALAEVRALRQRWLWRCLCACTRSTRSAYINGLGRIALARIVVLRWYSARQWRYPTLSILARVHAQLK